jgi:hypothetical protein
MRILGLDLRIGLRQKRLVAAQATAGNSQTVRGRIDTPGGSTRSSNGCGTTSTPS